MHCIIKINEGKSNKKKVPPLDILSSHSPEQPGNSLSRSNRTGLETRGRTLPYLTSFLLATDFSYDCFSCPLLRFPVPLF
jgi:hypothetical protein